MKYRVFLLSPAYAGGRRTQMILSDRASGRSRSAAISCRVNSAIRVNTNNDMRVWIIFVREALGYRFFARVLGRIGPR